MYEGLKIYAVFKGKVSPAFEAHLTAVNKKTDHQKHENNEATFENTTDNI
jgi:hypothetical protein